MDCGVFSDRVALKKGREGDLVCARELAGRICVHTLLRLPAAHGVSRQQDGQKLQALQCRHAAPLNLHAPKLQVYGNLQCKAAVRVAQQWHGRAWVVVLIEGNNFAPASAVTVLTRMALTLAITLVDGCCSLLHLKDCPFSCDGI